MARWGARAAAALSLGFCASLGCVDLFHATSFETVCDTDPHAKGCAAEGGVKDSGHDAHDAGSTDFCLWSSAEARKNAEHACGWLGACSLPYDHNAFGACMIDAILAYDCATNPNQTIAPGSLHDYWDALWRAKSCDDVHAVVTPDTCSGTGFGCAPQGGVIVACVKSTGTAWPEQCEVQGKVCSASTHACAPARTETPCKTTRCEGTVLHACAGGVDVGQDCKEFGAGSCVAIGAAPACDPGSGHGGGAACTPTLDVTCAGGVATGCVTGSTEEIDCSALLGAKGKCEAMTLTPGDHLSSACLGTGSCTPGCDGTDMLTDCAQGATFAVSCSALGLKACHKVALVGGADGYACTAP